MTIGLVYIVGSLVIGCGLIFWAWRIHKAEKQRPIVEQFIVAKKMVEVAALFLGLFGFIILSLGMMSILTLFN